ncbi:hypothetical protein D9756_005035 [Leucocoprinus leucothites]|uniref:P-loop containing nucleoside triphosphate hydrolase protein n=1 Tax=Leucocoprinus leucothites TaxID=201217 RepID=A0A8H5GA51_9AGAR|nr:hypothetical protein D9756_005035 [Leucoagaricus leucothites]
METRIVTIGIGGATSSGKTILAKHLRNSLHNSLIIHQDDFVPPAEKLPVDEVYGFTNWDDAPGAIDWDRMVDFLSNLKKTGNLPPDHQSFDGFNETISVPVDDEIIADWKQKSKKVASEHLEKYAQIQRLTTTKRIISNLDVRVFCRVPEDVAKSRREARAYYTPEGDTWRDPPQYWEKIVWPAYIRAHKHMFEGEDVANGKLNGKMKNLILFEGMETKIGDMINTVMQNVLDFSASKKE